MQRIKLIKSEISESSAGTFNHERYGKLIVLLSVSIPSDSRKRHRNDKHVSIIGTSMLIVFFQNQKVNKKVHKHQKNLQNLNTKKLQANSINKKNVTTSTVTCPNQVCPIYIDGPIEPLVGSKELLKLSTPKGTQKVFLETLLDSGSPTTFIREDKAHELELEIQETQSLTFRGVVSEESAKTSQATRIRLEFKRHGIRSRCIRETTYNE